MAEDHRGVWCPSPLAMLTCVRWRRMKARRNGFCSVYNKHRPAGPFTTSTGPPGGSPRLSDTGFSRPTLRRAPCETTFPLSVGRPVLQRREWRVLDLNQQSLGHEADTVRPAGLDL